MLALLGASPVGMPVPQVPEALAKGVIDGAVIPYEVAPGLRIQELTRFVAEPDRSIEALYTAVFLLPMNRARYDSLPPELKAVIDRHSGRELSGFLGATQAGDDAPAREVFAKTPGYTITPIPAPELERWKRTLQPLYEEFSADMTRRGFDGPALIQSARELIRQNTR
jgi:TRAP-type C4-dicarboxylate transport system substrate-binding protein